MKETLFTKQSSLVEALLLRCKPLFALIILVTGVCLTSQSCKKPDFVPQKTSSGNSANAIINGTYDLQLVADNFVSPLGVVDANDGSKRLFVIDQIGKVWIIFPDGTKSESPFLNISDRITPLVPDYDERGLLGLAFHPNYKSNGKFYVFYTARPSNMDFDNRSRISEFKVSSDANKADMSSERVVLQFNHPQSNHNGGTIAFGPNDGFLYISMGDGGGADDVGFGHVEDWYSKNAGGNGQDVQQNLLGDILRIDVNRTSENKAYGIPNSNPFVGKPGKDEIYAYGFRNPYRFSFDMGGAHKLIAGDAGQSLYEEIDVVEKGGNYGWNVKEGRHCFNTNDDLKERTACPVEDSAGNLLLDPVIEVKNTANPEGDGLAITVVGGNVYRGSSLPLLSGRYIFGFLSTGFEAPQGQIVVARPSVTGMWPFEILKLKSFPDNIGQWLKGFGQDASGEIYVTATTQLGPQGNTGKIWKLVSAE